MATSGATVIAAMAARARREVREHFEKSNAFDQSHAVAYDPPSRMHRRQFEALIGRGVVRDTGEGRYWIDRAAERLEQERRKNALKVVLVIIAIGVALAVAATAIASATLRVGAATSTPHTN